MRVELSRLEWAGKNLRLTGSVRIDPQDIIAQVNMDRCSVIYLRSGQKLLVQEPVEEIARRARLTETQREATRRFKREIRHCKASGMSVEEAFAAVWEEISAGVQLTESEQADLYQELLAWTKRWLK